MSYKTEADGTYKEVIHKHCRDILDGAIYNKSFDEIYKYYSECYLKKISKNTHYDDVIKKYENIIKMVKTYKDNSDKHYKDCLGWLKTNEVSLEIVDSKTPGSPSVGGVKSRKVNGMDFYTKKLKKHFEAFGENIVFGADPKNQKWLAKYQIGPGDGIQSWLLLEKVNDKWSPAQEDIIQRVLGKKLPSEGKNTGLYDILSDEYLGEPDSTLTDVGLKISETIKVNLDELKKKIEEFEKFNEFKIENKKRKSKMTDKTPEQQQDIDDIKGFEKELANITKGGESMVTENGGTSVNNTPNKAKDEKQPKNIILYGPPGTGKTYSTVERAIKIIHGEDFVNDIRSKYPDNEKEVYNQLKEEYKKQVADNHIKFVTFHQSYGYEDFIEGIKPVLTEENKASSGQNAQNQSAGTQVSYRIEDGVFKEFCKNADPTCVGEADEKEQETSKQLSIDDTSPENEDNGEQKAPEEQKDEPHYVFIIDEINRGNISKIFGELITLIEETKRKGKDEATSTILPYSKKRFFVPKNVYIIGTMNTADRSIAVVDTALRRRFTFEEMMPDSSKLAGITVDGIDIPELLDVMNCRITALYDREHTIGHSFFMPLKGNPSMALLGNIFKTKIIPLLQEYFFEDYEKIRLVLGDNQKKNKDIEFIVEEVCNSDELFNDPDALEDVAKFYSINEKAFESKEAYGCFGKISK